MMFQRLSVLVIDMQHQTLFNITMWAYVAQWTQLHKTKLPPHGREFYYSLLPIHSSLHHDKITCPQYSHLSIPNSNVPPQLGQAKVSALKAVLLSARSGLRALTQRRNGAKEKILNPEVLVALG